MIETKKFIFSYCEGRVDQSRNNKNEKINFNRFLEICKTPPKYPKHFQKLKDTIKEGYALGKSKAEIYRTPISDPYNTNIAVLKDIKEDLPYMLCGGFCEYGHGAKNLESGVYTGVVQGDLDFEFAGGDAIANELKTSISELPFVFFSTISPSGHGVKFFIATDNKDVNLHSSVVEIIRTRLKDTGLLQGGKLDTLNAGIPCFIPYGVDYIAKDNVQLLEVEKEARINKLKKDEERELLRKECAIKLEGYTQQDIKQEGIVKLACKDALFYNNNLGHDATGTHESIRNYYLKTSAYGVSITDAYQYLASTVLINHTEQKAQTFYDWVSDSFGYDSDRIKLKYLEYLEEKKRKEPVKFGGESTFKAAESDDTEIDKDNYTGYNKTPEIPKDIIESMPYPFPEILSHFSGRESDIVLTGLLGILSGCMPGVSGTYYHKRVKPNLYTLIIGNAGSSKGSITWPQMITNKLKKEFSDQNERMDMEYEDDLASYRKNKKDNKEPVKPPRKLLYAPANVSKTGLLSLMSNNKTVLMFDTEIATLSQALSNKDWGDYKTSLCKFFHHEPDELYRVTDDKLIKCEHPALSIIMSGTPRSVSGIFKDAEDGLFSRMMFYAFEEKSILKNPTLNGVDYYEVFKDHENFVSKLYNYPEYTVAWTKSQGEVMTEKFSKLLDRYTALLGSDADAMIKRLGLIYFRICMILTTCRLAESGEYHEAVYCHDDDFAIGSVLVDVFLEHAITVYCQLDGVVEFKDRKESALGKKKRFLDEMDNQFTTKEAKAFGSENSINDKMITRWLKDLTVGKVIEKVEHGKYSKI